MAADHGYVLDTSALIALIVNEPGADRVRQCMAGAVISSVNLAEAATVLMRCGGSETEVEEALRSLPLSVVPWTGELVWQGLDLNSLAWTAGISFGDRACLTLSRALSRTALTADTAWLRAAATVRPPIRVELFR